MGLQRVIHNWATSLSCPRIVGINLLLISLWNYPAHKKQTTPYFGLPRYAGGKEPACHCRLNIRHAGSFPGSGRSAGEGNGNPLQYSCLENPMDTGAWRATVHRISQSWTRLRWLSTTRLYFRSTLTFWDTPFGGAHLRLWSVYLL